MKRFELVFALANTIFLLFGTMYTTKESLEHLLLENHHSGSHHEKRYINTHYRNFSLKNFWTKIYN